jgi:glycosyltransferase involved in cell wall biosynthesis
LSNNTLNNSPASKGKLLFIAINPNPPGGGSCLGAWALQALSKDWEVTILCAERPDFAALNRHFNTHLFEENFQVRQLIWPINKLHVFDPDPDSYQRSAFLMRKCRSIGHKFNVIMNLDNEMDLGKQGIQYIHYPYLSHHMSRVDAVREKSLAGRVRAFFQGKYRPWMLVSGLSFDSVKNNLTLTNSNWTADAIQSRYGIQSVVLYPPVKFSHQPVPWQQRKNTFVSLGRIDSQKRQIEAINILEKVRARGHDIQLEIIGDISSAEYAKELADRALKAGSWVKISHGIGHDQLEQTLCNSRYGLHTMIEEHFGIAIAEMVRAGCIVFVSDSGGQVEIVHHEQALRYKTDEQAVELICAVLDDEEKQQNLRQSLSAHAQMFTEESFMKNLREIVSDFAENTQK